MIITAKAPSLSFMLIPYRPEYNFPASARPLEQCFHGMHHLRSSRQMLRQAIITSKTANAIVVANTVIIVANERTYITPYANVRNMLFPWTEKAPAQLRPGQVKQSVQSFFGKLPRRTE